MFSQIERPLFALTTCLQVNGGHYQLVIFRFGLCDDVPLGIDDHGARDEVVNAIVPPGSS